MNKDELKRLREIEERVAAIFLREGLNTAAVDFEIVPALRVIEGMAYDYPTNFSHWSFGRDYDRYRTIYEHTGVGIPYEQVWNLDKPRAFLAETNPFALNATIIAHVFGHVDFFLANHFLRHARTFSDIATEARHATRRFARYEGKYGPEVEKTIDAAFSIRWHQSIDPLLIESGEEATRAQLLTAEEARWEAKVRQRQAMGKSMTSEEVRQHKEAMHQLEAKTPPCPTYDLLHYVMERSPKPLRHWQRDILEVIWNQSRSLAPNRRTKLLNEGWATYWHIHVMRELASEGVISPDEHGTFNKYNAAVIRPHRKGFNPYQIGYYLFEYIADRWDKGQFGREYEECPDPLKRAHWDTGAGQGAAEIRQVRAAYTDQMAVRQFLTDEFIRERKLYLYATVEDPATGDYIDVVAERRPEAIREVLLNTLTYLGTPIVRVEDGNYRGRRELYLLHEFTGYPLDEPYLKGTLEHLYFLWGRQVHLETVEIVDPPNQTRKVIYSYDPSSGHSRIT